MTDDGDRRLSPEEEVVDFHRRAMESDLRPSDGRKKPGSCMFNILWSGLILAAGFGLLFVIITRLDLFASDSEPLNASGTESTATDQGAASSEPTSSTEGSISDTAGPISGTWAMYWTNVKKSENQAFTITFTGSDTGTLEILNDDTEFDTTFQVDGDEVMFEFTRTFEVPIGDWPEKSYFVGVLKGRNEMTGEWARQGWECWPDPDAGCASEVEWSRYPSRLIRISE